MEHLQSCCGQRSDALVSDFELSTAGESEACLSRWRKLQLLDVLVSAHVDAGDLSGGAARDIAELTLACAADSSERTSAVRIAMALGVPLNQIQEYLDWLDSQDPRLD